jgi:hypothetical protein
MLLHCAERYTTKAVTVLNEALCAVLMRTERWWLWSGSLARTGDTRNAYRILMREPLRTGQLENPGGCEKIT